MIVWMYASCCTLHVCINVCFCLYVCMCVCNVYCIVYMYDVYMYTFVYSIFVYNIHICHFSFFLFLLCLPLSSPPARVNATRNNSSILICSMFIFFLLLLLFFCMVFQYFSFNFSIIFSSIGISFKATLFFLFFLFDLTWLILLDRRITNNDFAMRWSLHFTD